MARKAFFSKKTGVTKTMRYTNASGATIPAGTPVKIGDIVGITIEDIANGATGAVDIDNEYDILCASGTTCVTGDKIWYNPSTGYTINGSVAGGADAFAVGPAIKARTSSDPLYLSVQLNAAPAVDDNVDETAVTTIADTAATLTPAQILGGLIKMTPTAGRAVTMPAASALIAAIKNCAVGKSVEFVVKNLAAATHAITMTESSSITNGGVAGDLTIAASGTARYRIVITDVTWESEAAVLYKV